MPSVSAKQHRLMAAVATNPAVAKRTKIPQSVGKEFMSADKGKKFTKSGGNMPLALKKKSVEDMKKDIFKPKDESTEVKYKRGGAVASKMGKVKTAAPSKDGVAVKGKTKGKMITMKSGGKMC